MPIVKDVSKITVVLTKEELMKVLGKAGSDAYYKVWNEPLTDYQILLDGSCLLTFERVEKDTATETT